MKRKRRKRKCLVCWQSSMLLPSVPCISDCVWFEENETVVTLWVMMEIHSTKRHFHATNTLQTNYNSSSIGDNTNQIGCIPQTHHVVHPVHLLTLPISHNLNRPIYFTSHHQSHMSKTTSSFLQMSHRESPLPPRPLPPPTPPLHSSDAVASR